MNGDSPRGAFWQELSTQSPGGHPAPKCYLKSCRRGTSLYNPPMRIPLTLLLLLAGPFAPASKAQDPEPR
ncbi:MAG: hypothetical protein R3F17_17210, partial [Planctomycetota bacterium]